MISRSVYTLIVIKSLCGRAFYRRMISYCGACRWRIQVLIKTRTGGTCIIALVVDGNNEKGWKMTGKQNRLVGIGKIISRQEKACRHQRTAGKKKACRQQTAGKKSLPAVFDSCRLNRRQAG